MNIPIGAELFAYFAISLAFQAWKKLRNRKPMGKRVGNGRIDGEYTPHKAVLALTEYVLSLTTMAVVSVTNGNYWLLAYYAISIVLVGIYEIRPLARAWNRVVIFEHGIFVNNEEFRFDKAREKLRGEDGRTILVYGKRKRVEYIEVPAEQRG